MFAIFPRISHCQYKLVRIVEVHPDEKNLVRTVTIVYRRKKAKEKPAELSKNSLVREKVGVQRLVLIQPANDATTDEADATTNEADQPVTNGSSPIHPSIPSLYPSVGDAMDPAVLGGDAIAAVDLPADAPADTVGIRQTRGTLSR